MIHRSLEAIQNMAGGEKIAFYQEGISLCGVSTDTRTLQPGQLFVPILGERFNGHDYLETAIEKGAAAALWNRQEPVRDKGIPLIIVEDTVYSLQQLARAYRRQLKVTVVGITGSNGKTSSKDILAGLLSTRYRTHKTTGNLNNQLGVPLTLLAMPEETEMAIIEMGASDPGDIRLLAHLAQPDVALITNIGEAHLDHLKTKENIFQAKMEILEGLKPGGLFVYPAHDPFFSSLPAGIAEQFQTLAFGEGGAFSPKLEQAEEAGLHFQIPALGSRLFFLPMVGRHQLRNAAGAMAIAHYFGVGPDQLAEGLLKVEATGARNEMIKTNRVTILNDSYKSNPLSLKAALETLYDLPAYSQRIAVLGDMHGLGDQTALFHRQAAQSLDPAQLDYVLTVGSFSEELAREARKIFPPGRVIHCDTATAAGFRLKAVVDRESIVLVKGSREQALEHLVAELEAWGRRQEDEYASITPGRVGRD